VDPDRRHPNEPRAATRADHIVPLREWQRDAVAAALALAKRTRRVASSVWSLKNGQGLCESCHNAKAQRER
jgi:5-methylcytosine-specific restriction endonuclease McrA